MERENEDVDPTVLLAYKDEDKENRTSWNLDTGASNHICRQKSMFLELDESVNDHVTFGHSSKIPVKGRSKILIRLKNENHQNISNVYYAPKMKNNILSLRQLLKKDYDIHMQNHSLSIRDQRSNLTTKVQMSNNRIFLLNIQNNGVKCLKACLKDTSWL